MRSLRLVRRKQPRGCSSGKRWYGSRVEVLAALNMMPGGREERRAYRCNLCNGWHLTSH